MAGKFFQCLGRTPFASLLAALMVIIGTCVFCGTSFQALQLIIVGVFNNLFRFNLNWLEVLQVLFVVIGVVMGLFAIILLIFGFLATGSTRNNIYSGPKCIMGGRITAALFMLISYVLTLGWLALMAVGMVSVTVYASVDSICTNEIYGKRAEELVTYCFNLTRFGVYREERNSDSVCDYANLRALCNKVTEAGPLFCVAFGATVLVVVGMVHFLITLAANYTRIKISRELTEYRDAVEMEELELHSTEKKDPPPYRDASDS
ncbi:proteolipid protein DM beta [Biomphalaria pfeifferi]|uniref:Proteolipid protein DM beta n=1 Tax=Biomphalaria pfeifferi TaxID=112525 RepID=A0AAD8C3I1_BIOPF|nr:proteolipid protein DM beta [Biomphalaria pfeifferi]